MINRGRLPAARLGRGGSVETSRRESVPWRQMTLRQRVFPPVPPRDKVIVRTRFVGSWESQLRGLGRHTAYLSEDLVEFRADVDDIAMDLVFLQRHRVEVGLKLLLERAGADVEITHNISTLYEQCLQALRDARHRSVAQVLDTGTREFVELMHAADPGSYAYRYPVDRQNQPAKREDYINLQEVEIAGAAFQDSVLDAVASLTGAEPVPVGDAEVEETAVDAASTVRALRTTVAFLEAMFARMERDGEQVASVAGRRGLVPTAAGKRAGEVADEQLVALRTLEPPLQTLLNRLAGRRKPDSEPLVLDADAIPAQPAMPPAAMFIPTKHAKQRMNEATEGIVRYFPPLKIALSRMLARTASWTSEADIQLHADLERFYSRILTGVDPATLEAQAEQKQTRPTTAPGE